MNCRFLIHKKKFHTRGFVTSLLITIWNTYKTGPLVNDEADNARCEEERNYDNDDQMDRMPKQAASSTQSADDRPASNDSCSHREQDETKREELTRKISHFRVRAVEQTLH